MAKIKVLIVDDEAIIAMDLKNRLEHLGYSITAIAPMMKQLSQWI